MNNRKRASALVATAAATSCFLAGCSGSERSSGSEGTSGLSGTLTMAAYGGATQDALASAYAEPFSKDNGVKIVQDPTFDYAKLKAQVDSKNVTWDVVEADPFSTIAGCGTQFEKVDLDLSGIDPKYAQDSECGAPANVYSVVLMYDTAKFGDNPPAGWADFFDTEKFPGKRGVFNYAVGGGLEAAAVAAGASNDSVYPLDLDAAFAKLDSIKKDISFYNTLGQSVEQVISGDVAMSMMWNTRAYAAVQAGASFAPAWEGNVQGWDSMAIPKGSKNLKAAKAFLQFIASPEPQQTLAENIPFGPTALKAAINSSSLTKPFLPSEHKDDAVILDQKWWSENLTDASTRWSGFAAG